MFSDIFKLILASTARYKPLLRTAVDGVIVSTIYAGDLDVYETAIVVKKHIHPVQRYNTEENARKGHLQ